MSDTDTDPGTGTGTGTEGVPRAYCPACGELSQTQWENLSEAFDFFCMAAQEDCSVVIFRVDGPDDPNTEAPTDE